jgi:hypothetical protein
MSIENRISKVNLNEDGLDSNYRAAVHKKFSEDTVSPEALRQNLMEDFVEPLDAETTKNLHETHDKIFNVFSDREIITLSSLGGHGLDSYLTETSPLKVAHLTGRNADLVADPAIQLAAEAYRRRLKRDQGEISLGAVHRCIRLQRYEDKNRKTNFEMFATLDSKHRDLTQSFETDKICELISRYIGLLSQYDLKEKLTVALGNIRLAPKILSEAAAIKTCPEGVIAELPVNLRGLQSPEILSDLTFQKYAESAGINNDLSPLIKLINILKDKTGLDPKIQIDRLDGLGHYKSLVFQILLGKKLIVDGGTVDWVRKLNSNNKEKTVVSGFGTQAFNSYLYQKDMI